MFVEEKIVIKKPKTIREGSAKRAAVWTRHAFLSALYKLRIRIMNEHGFDIFGVYEMTDCVEVNIKGDFEGLPCDPSVSRRSVKRTRMHNEAK